MKYQTFYLLNFTSFAQRDFGKKPKYYFDLCCLSLIIHILSFPGVTFQNVLFSKFFVELSAGKGFSYKTMKEFGLFAVLRHTFFLSPRKTFYSIIVPQLLSRLDIILGEEKQMWYIADNNSPHNAVCIFLGRVVH